MLGLERDDPPKKRDFEEVRLGTALLSLMILLGVFWFLAGCSGGGGSSGGAPLDGAPLPTGTQWATAYGENAILCPGTPCSFPMVANPGIHYVYMPAPKMALGQTVTLNYSLDGNAVFAPTPQNPASVTDIPPATISLFVWEAGDDLSCGGSPPAGPMQYYRQFGKGGTTGHANLVFGDNQTLSDVLAVANWTGCYGEPDGGAGFAQAVANAKYIGFTFSGQDFAGHGIDVTSGSATFTINSETVK